MSEIAHPFVKAAAAALIGAAVGWGASALTLSGRVDAIERMQHRLEDLVAANASMLQVIDARLKAAKP